MTSPTLRLLSLGAGVQSTVLALMAADGTLPGLDAAIFADTGWEPRRVYDHLDRLEKVLADAGIPLHRVSNGNLRNDAIDPAHRYASIPYFVLNHRERQEPIKSTGYTCPDCAGTGWADGKLRDERRTVEWFRSRPAFPELDDLDPEDPADAAVLAEMDAAMAARCPSCFGETVRYREHYTVQDRVEGMGRRQCTSEYKLSPINRKVRELLGAAPPDFRRVPKGRVAEQWIGFSTDEVGRVSEKDQLSYVQKSYPLLELGMDRQACHRWLTDRGWGEVAKSACIGCPFHGNRQWRDLRDNHPDEWADAVDFDRAIRKGGARGLPLDGEAFLHRSRLPLSIAPIDRRTVAERSAAQGDILAELGDPDGCSPYACRSGLAVVGGAR